VGDSLWGDQIGGLYGQAILVGYSTADGSANFVMLDAGLPVQPASGANWAVTGPLTDTELRATPVPVSGTVTASGPLTDTELRATPVPVSGTVTASGPLTDTQLRATPVPVSGCLTDTELRATPVPVSGTVTASGPLTDTELRAADVKITLDNEAVVLGAGSAAIGDVDVTSVVPGTAANSLGKAEDAGHTSGDVGVMALGVRKDTAAALAGTDADYMPLILDAIGRLHTNNTEVSGWVYDGTTLCEVKRFHVPAPSDGADLIAAVSGKKFRILSFGIISISGTICRFWLEDSDGTDVYGNSTGIALEEDSGAAVPGFVLNRNVDGWFQTAAANKDLHIKFASGSGVVCWGTYIEVA
jgi:hypothetical protein